MFHVTFFLTIRKKGMGNPNFVNLEMTYVTFIPLSVFHLLGSVVVKFEGFKGREWHKRDGYFIHGKQIIKCI